MRNLLKFSLLLILMATLAGCSTAKLANIEEMSSKQQTAQKDLLEKSDMNAAAVRELQNSIADFNQRITMGPKTKATNRAVITAPPARKVR